MKQLINKCCFLALLAFLNITLSTRCSQQPWYNSIISEGRLYKMSVAGVDLATGFRKMISKPIMAINPDKSINALKTKLVLMEKKIRMAEKQEIYAIAQKNGLNDDQIKRLFHELKELKISYKEFLNNEDHCGNHDISIPQEHIALIKETLANAQMSANNIHIINTNEPHSLVAETITDCSFRIIENNTNDELYEHRFNDVNMLFYPDFYKHNHTNQSSTCIHEARHVIEGHGLSNAFIKFFIRKNSVNNDIDSQKLIQIYERQAEVLPSIQDKESALLMRTTRSDGYYQNMLYSQHYLQLSDIDETHKMIAYLENINAQNNS